MFVPSSWLLYLLGAAVLPVVLLVLMIQWNMGSVLLDYPNLRSLHTSPIPRIGGIAILFTLFIGLMIYPPYGWLVIAPLLALLAIVSLCDDKYNLPVFLRLGVHFAAAIIFVWQLLSYYLAAPVHQSMTLHVLNSTGGSVLLVVIVVWVMNLYNFMDGADGLAGGMTAIGFMTYAIAASASGATDIRFMSTIVSGAAVGFLFFNFPPARVFMGDAGSIPLGFLVGALGVMGYLQNAWPWWFPVLVFSPFIVDATVTILKRACQGKKIWTAHREHYYQRLVLMGWSHKRLALTEYVLMLACAGSALYAIQLPASQAFANTAISTQNAILIFWCLVYIVLGITLEIVLQRHQRQLK
jgi:UDP-N-acetylmuramyl pentapeptide phosphotransferase/UDP-N-acetylglucosamine-1-phosphate transferase